MKCNYFAHIYLISRRQCLHSGKSLIMNIRDLSNWSDQSRKLQIRNLGTHQKLGTHLKWLEKRKTNLKMYTFSVFRTKRLTNKKINRRTSDCTVHGQWTCSSHFHVRQKVSPSRHGQNLTVSPPVLAYVRLMCVVTYYKITWHTKVSYQWMWGIIRVFKPLNVGVVQTE